ncbi:MAG: hypothetical protein WC910_07880 [Bacteroidales bacterium]|jgi:predicted DNA-binding protein
MVKLKAKTVAVRIPDVKLKRLKAAAKEAGQTFSAYAVEAMERRAAADKRLIAQQEAHTING